MAWQHWMDDGSGQQSLVPNNNNKQIATPKPESIPTSAMEG